MTNVIMTSVLALLVLAPITRIQAQRQPPPVEPGARVRVTGPESCDPNTFCFGPPPPRRRTGVFVAYERDTLMFSGGPRGDPLAVPLTSITKLEVHRGQQPRGHTALWVGEGLVAGAMAGAAIAGGIGLFVHAAFNPFDQDLDERELTRTMLQFAVVGSVLGMISGFQWARKSVDRWEEVPLDRLRVSFGPQRDGRFGLGLLVGF